MLIKCRCGEIFDRPSFGPESAQDICPACRVRNMKNVLKHAESQKLSMPNQKLKEDDIKRIEQPECSG